MALSSESNVDVIIVCHTEFGHVENRELIFEKDPVGVEEGVPNLVGVAEKYGAKITFAVCPEVVSHFPKGINHEIGLHIHPGWSSVEHRNSRAWVVGDAYLKEHCQQSINSNILRDYSHDEQLNMIKCGKEYVKGILGVDPRVFVAGKWCEDNNTIRALVTAGFTHSCSAVPHSKCDHYDWSKLPRIYMPYHPGEKDYQQKGSLPLLIVPISQILPGISVTPEILPSVGLSWLKAGFTEYYQQDMPLFHICLHSPCTTNQYFVSGMERLLDFISRHRNVNFKFASEVTEYAPVRPRTNLLPYIAALNRDNIRTFTRGILRKCWR